MTFAQSLSHVPVTPRQPAAGSLSVLTPINVLAERLGVTSRALRHYEAIGLVAARRGTRSVRYYDRDAVELLEAVTLLRSVDVPIADIRDVMQYRGDQAAYDAALKTVLANALLERRRCAATIESLIETIGT